MNRRVDVLAAAALVWLVVFVLLLAAGGPA